MYKINIITDCNDWKKKILRPNNYFRKKIAQLSAIKDFTYKNLEFTILLTNNKKMRKLNKKFRKKNKSTDILSFPNLNKKKIQILTKLNQEIYLGDIIINFKKMNTMSKDLFKKHFNILWIHGLIHLFGYDHKRNSSYKKMDAIEKKFLRKLS